MKKLKHIIEKRPTFLLLIRTAFQSSWNSFLTLNKILIIISGNPSCHWIQLKGIPYLYKFSGGVMQKKKTSQFNSFTDSLGF